MGLVRDGERMSRIDGQQEGHTEPCDLLWGTRLYQNANEYRKVIMWKLLGTILVQWFEINKIGLRSRR